MRNDEWRRRNHAAGGRCVSWVYLPVQVVMHSPVSSSAGAQLATSTRTNSPARRSCAGSSIGLSLPLPCSAATSGTLFDSVSRKSIREWLMSCQRASHVSRSASPASAWPRTIRAICGQQHLNVFALYDHRTSFWKTSRTFGARSAKTAESARLLTSDEFSATWPRAGLILRGIAYRHQPLAPLTGAIGSGLWPTPTVAAASQGMSQPDGKRGQTLIGALRGQNWRVATPRSSDATRGRWHQNRASMARRPLCEQIGGRPNPDWIEWLMGWPIRLTACEPLARESFRQWLALHGCI